MRVVVGKMKLGVRQAMVVPGSRSGLPPVMVQAGTKEILLVEVRELLDHVSRNGRQLPPMPPTG